ncbi:LuxR C-terminal-related transcriptional regulator [Agrococcus sp. HG114]|uniref:helix-turn-helix transcriptional regulator n=1 Tax=Agrococcus sp. HG114 TaxID=2969757 RepID=UPI00215AC71B|nr:LuxR C-terminal-related transcriptional regulator [Agrococcus sp. HG114]MCR8671354.1 LuxR C-terminal-related transcriptional regulator [Agrococcus sp. HG114]
MDVHSRVERVRAALRDGDMLGAIRRLEEAREHAAGEAERLVVEVHTAAFRLAATHETFGRVPTAQAWAALEGTAGAALPPALRRRLELELRISDGIGAYDVALLDEAVRGALELARDDPGSLPTAERAVNNRLAVRIAVLERVGIAPGEPGHADALLAIGEALTLADALGARGTIDRRAVTAAVTMGDWPRAWEWAQRALESDALVPRERVGIATEAALLALERGMRAEARELGALARAAGAGRSAAWARLWAGTGAVVHAAAGGASMHSALGVLERAVEREQHRKLPHFALRAALIALEAGLPGDRVFAFVEQCLGVREGWPQPWRAVLEATAGRLEPERVSELDAWADGPAGAWQRATALRLRARLRLRAGSATAASADVVRGLRVLAMWEGARREALERLRARMLPQRAITPAQAAVLRLLVLGRTDREIAAELGRSPRTVETHVRALLREYGAANRVALAVAASREPFLES